MKKKYLFIEFVLFFLYLVIPPLLVTSATPFGSESSAFSLVQLVEQLAISVLLTVQYYKILQERTECNTKTPFYILSKATMTFGLLMIIYAMIESVSFFIPDLFQNQFPQTPTKPDSIFKWLHFICGIFVSAFYEESLYRQFMPEASLLFIRRFKFKTEKIKSLSIKAIEITWIVIFALSHRYLGIPAVINAFCCGVILRKCFKSTNNILACTASHFAYNLLLVIFYFLTKS